MIAAGSETSDNPSAIITGERDAVARMVDNFRERTDGTVQIIDGDEVGAAFEGSGDKLAVLLRVESMLRRAAGGTLVLFKPERMPFPLQQIIARALTQQASSAPTQNFFHLPTAPAPPPPRRPIRFLFAPVCSTKQLWAGGQLHVALVPHLSRLPVSVVTEDGSLADETPSDVGSKEPLRLAASDTI